jgi:uncharacterized protein YcgI (DUF1989 family)
MAVPVSYAALTTLRPRTGTAFALRAGATLTVVDLEGEQVADLVAFAADDPREALSNGRTFDYEETIALTTGNRLWSNRSTPLLTIVRDDVGTHDFLLAPCSRETWRICYGGEHDDVPGCFGNLAVALSPYGIAADTIPTAFNVFMHVSLDPDGRVRVCAPRSKPGDRFAVRAEKDLIVGLTACSAMRSNNGRCSTIGYRVDANAG